MNTEGMNNEGSLFKIGVALQVINQGAKITDESLYGVKDSVLEKLKELNFLESKKVRVPTFCCPEGCEKDCYECCKTHKFAVFAEETLYFEENVLKLDGSSFCFHTPLDMGMFDSSLLEESDSKYTGYTTRWIDLPMEQLIKEVAISKLLLESFLRSGFKGVEKFMESEFKLFQNSKETDRNN